MISINVDINNESRIDIEDVRVSLKKIVRYNASIPREMTKEEITTEAEIRCGALKRRSKVRYQQQLFIPAVPPTNINYCRVLNVSYEIRVKCKVSTISLSPVIKLPIVIGTVPLNLNQNVSYQNTPSGMPTPMIENLTYDQMIGAFTPQINIEDPNLPPSYAEAVYTQENATSVQISEDGENSMGNIRPFNPMYPVYYGIEGTSNNNRTNDTRRELERY